MIIKHQCKLNGKTTESYIDFLQMVCLVFREVDYTTFVTKFLNLLYSGKSALLTAECHAGKMFAKVEMQMCIEDVWPPPPYHPPPPTQRRQPGPSRLRRRARRAHARAEAAAKAESTIPAADQAVPPPVPQAKDAAVQAAPETATAALQTADTSPPTPEAAVQVVHQVSSPHPHGAAEASQSPQANCSPLVQDVFCPDRDFLAGLWAEQEHDRREQAVRRREEHERDLESVQDMIEKSLKNYL